MKNLPMGVPTSGEAQQHIEAESRSTVPCWPPYRLGRAEQDEVEEQIKDMLAQGLARPSCTSYGAPVLFVRKKDGRW